MTISFDATGAIVVGTDLSDRARHAVDWAADRAADLKRRLIVVLALPEVPIPSRSRLFEAMGKGDYPEHLRSLALERLQALLDRVQAQHPELTVETVLDKGLASYVLAQSSKVADMVVVGARGANAPMKVRALGGTADAVVAYGHGPIAVVTDHGTPTAGGPVVVAEPERADPGDPVVMGAPGNAEVFGTLIVPRFGADWAWPLAGGTGLEDVLNVRRVGHYDGTQMPGEVGNMVLAAHRTGWGSPFIDANKLQVGDPIFIETQDGWYEYTVRSHEYVTPSGVGVLDPVPQMPGAAATDRILTLTTCNPLHSVSERLINYAVYETWYPRSGGAPAEIAGLVQASAAG